MEDIKIIIDTNAEQAGKSFDDLGKKFNDTNMEAQDLRKQIKGLKDELYKLTPGTEEYGRVLQELGGKMDQLSDTSQELRVATGGLDTVFQSTTNAMSTLAAGFTAATGVVALFGGDTEDLAKTFVKLQAVMSIMNGLKGFAGFGKATKQASTSLKAYIAQMGLARSATMQQATANTAMATTAATATASTAGLGTAVKGLTAAIAANPIGAILVTITAAVAAITHFVGKAKEAREQMEHYNEVLEKSRGTAQSFSETIERDNENLEKRAERMRTLGASETEVNEVIKKGKEELVSRLEAQKQALEASIEQNKSNTKMKESLEKWEAELDDVNSKLKDFRKTLLQISDAQTLQQLNNTLANLSDTFRVRIAEGLATQGDYLQAQIDTYKKAYDDLWETVGGGRTHSARKIKGANTDEKFVNQQLATRFKAQINSLQVELDVYNAGLRKKANDAAKNAADNINKNYKKLTDDITEKALEYKDAWKKALEGLQGLGGLTEGDVLTPNESLGRAFTEMNRYRMQIDDYLDEWEDTAEKALRSGEITRAKFEQFKKFLEGVKDDLDTSLLADMDENLSKAVLDAGSEIQSTAEKFKKDNEAMLEALSGGLVSTEEYHQFLESRIQDYQKEIGPAIEQAMEMIDEEVAKAAPEDQGRLREIMTAYIQSADDIIPPSVMNQITNSLKEMIDKQFNTIENEYTTRLNMFSSYWEDKTRSWLEGGTDTSYWGDSASTTYKKMQQQAEDIYKLLHSEYEQEIQLLQEKIGLLDENSEAYAQYYQKLLELRQADADAQAAYQTASIANIRQYSQDVIDTAGKFTDAVSGLAGAMGSYYAEQAEWAKETYGENSEEYRKYLKKEGDMKIAQVWTDAATGIMTAWATSEQLGPIAGPILAAIQTAALTATAIASTQQIKRQTKATASGSAPTANVSGITDRVIMGEAQNADQRAQLNADYNQGEQRVYVTQSDLDDGRRTRNVAVTQNRF